MSRASRERQEERREEEYRRWREQEAAANDQRIAAGGREYKEPDQRNLVYIGWRVCTDCYAWIDDVEGHDAWHRSLSLSLRQAR